MRIVGIDPGADLALCLLDGTTHAVRMLRATEDGLDESALKDLLAQWQPDIAYIERVGAMPDQGSVSGFGFGVTWGLVRGVCRGMGIEYRLVTPQSWKRVVLDSYDMGPPLPKPTALAKGTPRPVRSATAKADRSARQAAVKARKAAQKAAAIDFVRRQFPGLDLVPPRGRVENHNLAEAACIACYGLAAVTAAQPALGPSTEKESQAAWLSRVTKGPRP